MPTWSTAVLTDFVVGQPAAIRGSLPGTIPRSLPGTSVVVDAATRHTAKHPERMMMRIEQHLVRLQRIGPDNEGTAVAKLEVSGLQLCPFAADNRPVLTPV